MIRINLYKKNSIDMNLLIGTFEKEKFNMPFYNTNITLHKGVDETIEFSVRNHDRKAQKLDEGCYLKFVAVNQELQQIIEKEMDVVNENLGRYSITLTKNELNDYDCGTFTGHVCIVKPDESEELLYSGVDWYPYFDVEIIENNMELFEESVVMDSNDFVKDTYQDDTNGITYERFLSSIIESDKLPTHTFNIVINKDFIGTIYIQGSNMENPEHNEDDWFDIKVFDINEEESSEEESTIKTLTASAELNVLYLRIKYIRELDSESIIEEVTYRN